MADSKPPFDPFGPGERTVIKPNPGGRRDVPSQNPQQGFGQLPPATPSSSQDVWGGQRELPQARPIQPAAPVPSPQPRASASIAVPDLDGIAVPTGPNPILDAARPILLLLSNVRIARQVPQVAPLMDTVVKGIDSFEATLRARGINEDHVKTAKYVVCATADDIVQNLPSTDRLIWTQYSMLSRYFQVRDSGVGFFDELTKLRTNPTLNFDLLSLMHACLSLGFEGKFRVAGGDVPLQQTRRDLFQTLRNLKARTTADIGPHWRGQDIPPAHVRRPIPMWVIGSGALGVLLASFVGFRWLLGGEAEATTTKLASLDPQTEIVLLRAKFEVQEPVVIPETTQLERIRTALADDINAKRLSAEYAGKDIVVRLLNDSVFDRGSASVRDSFVVALGRVALVLDKEQGNVRVVGHSDDTPLKSTVKFKDNQDLSEQRAKAVALLLLPGLNDPSRLKTQGLADTAPLNPAKTPEARAMNRRVEVFIPRDDQ
jgi:type VI secretion system protein ImpK